MSQRQRILIAQQQRLALNTSLHASIRLLKSDAAGLTRYLEEQVAENPHLRLVPPEPAAMGDWLPRWSGVLQFSSRSDATAPEPAAAQPGLVAHVVAAIRSMDLPRDQQRIALALVEALEPSGWLGRKTADIARELEVPEQAVTAVLRRLQGLEPTGIFARNLAECLVLQLTEAGQMDAEMQVIVDHLDMLAAGDMARLARLSGCDEAGILRRFRLIRSLNPKPGSAFSAQNAAHLREPDLVARPLKGGRWQVALNRSALPSVDVVEAADKRDPAALQAARALRHMLSARNETLLKIGREIAARQIAALLQGQGALRPMTMAEVGAAVGLHVSTVSRAVAGASLDSPHGVWWLRQMFSGARGPGEKDGDGPRLAVAALRDRVKGMIAAESPEAPLSDAALAEKLAQETGVTLARRTVAQYRDAAGIPPAHRRRRDGKSPRRGPKRPPTG